MLVDLAKALNVSADELLGIKPSQSVPAGSRLERRLKKSETFGPKSRKQITQLIDTLIEAEQLKQRINSSQLEEERR